MPVLKVIPEPRFVKDGRTKVFEVSSFCVVLIAVHGRSGEKTYGAKTRQTRYSLIRGERQRSSDWNDVRFRGTAIERTDSAVCLRRDVADFSAASTDTTATALSYAGYFLLKNPQTWATLCEEIRREFKNVDEITQQRLKALPYLNAAIREGDHSREMHDLL